MKKKTELTNKKEAWIDLGFSEADVDRRLAGLNEIRTAIEKLEDQKRKLEESGEAWLLPDVSSISQKLEDEQKKLEKLRQKEDAAIRGADHLYETFKNSEYSDRHIADDSKNLRWLKERQEELSKAGVGPGYKEYDRNVIAIHTLSEELKEYEKNLVRTKQKESAAAEEATRLRAIADNAEVGDQKIVELNQDLARLKARQEELLKMLLKFNS